MQSHAGAARGENPGSGIPEMIASVVSIIEATEAPLR